MAGSHFFCCNLLQQFFSFSGATARIFPWPLRQFPSRCPYPLLVSSILLYSAAMRSPSCCCLPISIISSHRSSSMEFSIQYFVQYSRIICLDYMTGLLYSFELNPLKPELNPICYLLALLGGHHFLHVSRIRVKLLTLRLLMSYIYGAPILDVSRSHTTTQHSR